MTGVVHLLLGAAVGSFAKTKTGAFAAGAVSHAAADVFPHSDIDPRIDVPIMAFTAAVIGAIKGFDSVEFWGAVGGVLPDLEHGLELIGVIDKNQKIFPTHIKNGKYHGPDSDEKLGQLLIATMSTAIILMADNGKNDE